MKMAQQDKESAILSITEDMIRDGGYNSFSFRSIADAVGIKSSSVHYHFATKEDLGVAVTERYTQKFIGSLGSPAELIEKGIDPIESYVAAFRAALIEDSRMCLCGMLGAELSVLPSRVAEQVTLFFDKNIKWLEEAFKAKGNSDAARSKAIHVLSLLEGAMISSNAMGDIAVFDLAAGSIAE